MNLAGRSLAPWLILINSVVLLTGCAGYQAFRDGNSRIAAGDTTGGLAKLREASDLEPGDVQYRQTYYTQRDIAVNRLLREADLALQNAQFDAADKKYLQVLSIDMDNDRALQGRTQLERYRSASKVLDAAEVQEAAGQIDLALSAVRGVLAADANMPRAIALLHKFEATQGENRGRDRGIYPKLSAAYRNPVSLTLNNATLLQIFESLKLASKLNFIFDRDVKTEQRMTLQVSNKAVEDVIRLILAANQLDQRVLDEDTLLIYPNSGAKAADYREMVTRAFYLSYADIKQMAMLLKTIVHAKDVFVDEKLNVIIMRDSAEVVHLAEKLIATEDVPDPEVLLELEVLEVSTARLLQLGVQWPSSVAASVEGTGGQAGEVTLSELHKGGAGLVTLQFSNPLLSAQLLEQASDSDLLANPRVRVRNRETAKILIGQRLPVVTSNSVANVGVSQSVSYLDVGLKLEIEPTVSLDQDVSMKVALEVSTVQNQTTLSTGTIVYTLGTRNASTILRVRDNETQVLAGLIQRDRTNSNSGVPGLNDLPVLNKLFGQANNNDSKSEVVLLITPHIVRNVRVPPIQAIELPAGTESGMGAAPIQLGRPGNPAPANQPSAAGPVPHTSPTTATSPSAPPSQGPRQDVTAPQNPPAFMPPPMIPSAPGTLPTTELIPSPTVLPQLSTSGATGELVAAEWQAKLSGTGERRPESDSK